MQSVSVEIVYATSFMDSIQLLLHDMTLYSVGVAHIVEVESVHGGVKARLVLAQLAFDPHLVAHDTEDNGYDGD